MSRTVTTVDAQGRSLGEMDIWEAHRSPGILHRAFSVFVFSPDRSRLMLQKRAESKPTFAGLWGNTRCSHQFRGETDIEAGGRRLMEEMGFTIPLTKGVSFVYQADDPRGNGMSEHEHDTIVFGHASDSVHPVLNRAEASAWKWVEIRELELSLKREADLFVPWLSIALTHLL